MGKLRIENSDQIVKEFDPETATSEEFSAYSRRESSNGLISLILVVSSALLLVMHLGKAVTLHEDRTISFSSNWATVVFIALFVFSLGAAIYNLGNRKTPPNDLLDALGFLILIGASSVAIISLFISGGISDQSVADYVENTGETAHMMTIQKNSHDNNLALLEALKSSDKLYSTTPDSVIKDIEHGVENPSSVKVFIVEDENGKYSWQKFFTDFDSYGSFTTRKDTSFTIEKLDDIDAETVERIQFQLQ